MKKYRLSLALPAADNQKNQNNTKQKDLDLFSLLGFAGS